MAPDGVVGDVVVVVDGRAGEELGGPQIVVAEEEPGQGAREEVRAQQAAVVDERAPRPADAAAEDVREHVVGEQTRQVHLPFHPASAMAMLSPSFLVARSRVS